MSHHYPTTGFQAEDMGMPMLAPTTLFGFAAGGASLLLAQIQAAPWWGSVMIASIACLPAVLQYLDRRADRREKRKAERDKPPDKS